MQLKCLANTKFAIQDGYLLKRASVEDSDLENIVRNLVVPIWNAVDIHTAKFSKL